MGSSLAAVVDGSERQSCSRVELASNAKFKLFAIQAANSRKPTLFALGRHLSLFVRYLVSSLVSISVRPIRLQESPYGAMSNPNGGGIPLPSPSSVPHLPDVIPMDPEVEELWSSRALLLVSTFDCSLLEWAGRDAVGCYSDGKRSEKRVELKWEQARRDRLLSYKLAE